MSFWKRIFGRKLGLAAQNPLVAKLVSNDESTFLDGLRETVPKADAGDLQAVEAIRETMRTRSGKNDASFYQPGIVLSKGLDRYTEARPKILELARKRALLDYPFGSGDLVSAFICIRDHSALSSLLHDIYAAGGPSEGYAFQLLFNELRASARINACK